MIKCIKRILWYFSKPNNRYELLNSFIESAPGITGQKLRAKLASRYVMDFKGGRVIIHKRVTLQGIHNLSLGKNVQIGNDTFIQATGKVVLGMDVMIGPGSKIWSVNHKFNNIDIPIYEQGYEHEPVTIEDGVWLGANSFVMPGVTIPKGCIVCACTVVNKKKYKPYSILSGNPCRMIGSRLPKQPAPLS